jgi:hypothetical protein
MTFFPGGPVLTRLIAVCLLALPWLTAHAYAGPGALRAKYGELRGHLSNNNFRQAMHVDSSESGDVLKGDVYAVIDHPFTTVSRVMKDPDDWCDILLLPFNTKYCRAFDGGGGATLQVRIGRRYDQPVQDAYQIDFALRPVIASAEYFESRLTAASGPVGTRDYRIVVSAVPLDQQRTFMHFSYAYATGMTSRLAMQGYLATAGADKVGFTVTGRDGGGRPIYIGGVRGAIERTAMRYYLAIDAHLESLRVPAAQQLEKRIGHWFAQTERYPRQLHEMDRGTYVAMKREEYERQEAKTQ